jgi:hypothetical protein
MWRGMVQDWRQRQRGLYSALRNPSAETSMWRDLNVFNEIGIPSVCYGLPRQRERLSGAQTRAMKIDVLVGAAKVYALSAMILCGVQSS